MSAPIYTQGILKLRPRSMAKAPKLPRAAAWGNFAILICELSNVAWQTFWGRGREPGG